jgi:NAD(P)-dependent dehydrogenase (short-subunit alcohol dehydrogenase family)
MNKTIIVTGANTGIGRATALGLAGEGCHVVMACRNREKSEKTRQEIIGQSGNREIDLLIVDLASQKSIRAFAGEVKLKYKKIDVLINNAGVSLQEYTETEDGIEWNFAVNHLGPFLLTNLLLDLLKKSGPARIVAVSSGIHPQAKLDLADMNLKSKWNPYRSYANSKLCNIYFTYEIAGRLNKSGVTANCFAPGFVKSDFFRYYKKMPLGFNLIINLIGRTPEKAAETSLYLALSPEVEGVSGKYFYDCKPRSSSKISYNKEIAKRLWDISAKLCRLG